jgi:hypothetical protein
MKGLTSWTSDPHSTGRRIHLAVYSDGWASLGLLGEGDRLVRECFGPLSRDEQGTAMRVLLKRVLTAPPTSTVRRGEEGRLEALARAGVALMRLEANLPAFVGDDTRGDVDDALGVLRAALVATAPEGVLA